MTKWTELANKFMDMVISIGGPSKSSSGLLTINFSGSEISIEFGTYDIPSYNQHYFIGPFRNEKEALDAVEFELNRMQDRITQEANYGSTNV